MRAIAVTAPSTTTTKNISAPYSVKTSLPRLTSTFNPLSPMVAAIAPKTPNGANSIT